MYGERNASLVAHVWCHRIRYFSCVWRSANGDPAFVFTQEHVNAYVEQPSFAAMSEGLSGPRWARVCKLRSLAPC
eukprot:7741162-Lingulodinium_polyedra.AAC.1